LGEGGAARYPEGVPPTLRITALDTTLDLTFAEPVSEPLVAAATRAWSRCLVDGAPSRTAEPLEVPPPPGSNGSGLASTLQYLTQAVTRQLIAAQTGRLLMLHAGAVSHPETGASLVFVAPSGTGKTTLARLLGRSYGFLTDETVGIEPTTGRIHPYPKPLSLVPAGGGAKRETSPDCLGLRDAHPRPTVARIVILTRHAGFTGSPRAEELGTLDAISALVPETSALNRLPRPLRTLAGLLDRTGPVLRVSYGEAEELVPLAAELIGAAP